MLLDCNGYNLTWAILHGCILPNFALSLKFSECFMFQHSCSRWFCCYKLPDDTLIWFLLDKRHAPTTWRDWKTLLFILLFTIMGCSTEGPSCLCHVYGTLSFLLLLLTWQKHHFNAKCFFFFLIGMKWRCALMTILDQAAQMKLWCYGI